MVALFAPVADCLQLRGCGRRGDWRIPTDFAAHQAVQICVTCGLTGCARREERLQDQGGRVFEVVYREFGEGQLLPAARPCAAEDHATEPSPDATMPSAG